jgi:hypothetical protein
MATALSTSDVVVMVEIKKDRMYASVQMLTAILDANAESKHVENNVRGYDDGK